jgi:hypothetical protein
MQEDLEKEEHRKYLGKDYCKKTSRKRNIGSIWVRIRRRRNIGSIWVRMTLSFVD